MNRQDWLKERRRGIGASEAAIVVGESPYGSPASLWALKCGLLDDDALNNDDDRERQEIGLEAEALIARRLAVRTGRKVALAEQYKIVWSAEVPWLFCTPDAFDATGRIVQLKNVDANLWREWHKEPPTQYVIQVLHEMFCTGRREATLAALVGGNRFFHYDIGYDAEFYEGLILPELQAFWELVRTRESPPICGHPATSRMLKNLHPDDNGVVVALPEDAEQLFTEYQRCKLAEKKLKAVTEMYRNKLAALIGPNTGGVTPCGLELELKTVEVPAHVRNASKSRRLNGRWPRGMTPALELGTLDDSEKD